MTTKPAVIRTADFCGTTGCPCSQPAGRDLHHCGRPGRRCTCSPSTDHPYPTSYGTNCATHDVATEPYADASGAPLADAADWCSSSWCWVDPANCDIQSDPSSYFHIDGQEAVLHYSYGTCASENTFTDTELDAQACNEEHSDVVAEHCAGGIQEDPRCPCVDWADGATRAPFENLMVLH